MTGRGPGEDPSPTTSRDDDPEVGGGPAPVDDDRRDRGGRAPRRQRGPVVSFVREVAIVLGSALVISLVIKTFFAQAFYIPSVSMQDTLDVGDRIVVNKLVPGPFDIERGDVVVFVDPGGWLSAGAAPDPNAVQQLLTWVGLLPQHAGEHLVKRVIGLPGDHVVCCDAGGQITVNGEPIEEPYVVDGAEPSLEPFDEVVPAEHLWVMGDNRPQSADSRFNEGSVGGGFVPVRNVVGRVFVVVWPVERVGILERPDATFDDVPEPS